jgi:hypothetical protein
MTSLQTRIKQIPANDGYYITIADARNSFYVNIGTDAAPLMSTNLWARSSNTSTIMSAAGGIFRDMGKTLVSSTRVFRKVQLLANTTASPSEGVIGAPLSATNTSDYLSGFIELPGTGGMSSGAANGAGAAAGLYTPVARLG